jgi:hypothetical protein
VFVGHDWAEAHHDVFIDDDTGRKLGSGRLPEGVEGVARFHGCLRHECLDDEHTAWSHRSALAARHLRPVGRLVGWRGLIRR